MSAWPPFREIRTSFHGVKARYCPALRPTTQHEREITDRFNPKQDAVKDLYSRVPPNTLLWRVITNTSQKKVPKAVMRNRLKRRWANAFADSLRQNGYHYNGRSMEGPKKGPNYISGLKGSVELHVFTAAGLELPYVELVKSSNSIIKALRQKTPNADLVFTFPRDKRMPKHVEPSVWSMLDSARQEMQTS